MSRVRSLLTFACTFAVVAILGSCKEDTDYVRVVVRSANPDLSTTSPFDMRVFVSGKGAGREFGYTAQRAGARLPDPERTQFTVSFDPGASGEVDIRVLAPKPSGRELDWGGDVRIALPGDARTVPLLLAEGESTPVVETTPLDAVVQSVASYGEQIALAWRTSGSAVATTSASVEDLQAAVQFRPPFGTDVRRVRITSRPTGPQSGASDLIVTSYTEAERRPVIRVELRNVADPVQATIDDVPSLFEFLTAVDPSPRATYPIVSAGLANGELKLWRHRVVDVPDTDAGVRRELSTERIPVVTEPIAAVHGMVVTPAETVTLAVVAKSGSKLLQVSFREDATRGTVVAEAAIQGAPATMSLNADGTRVLVASVEGTGAEAKLLLQPFFTQPPQAAAPPAEIARFPYTPGDRAARVALASCAIAWPRLRADGSGRTDVWYQLLDQEPKPLGDPHVLNVSQEGHHWGPSLACLSPTRGYATMFAGPSTRGDPGTRLTFRALPVP